MSDLISREDAIEAIQNAYCKPCKERGDDYHEVRCRACDFDDAIIQIDALPSAEAEWKRKVLMYLADLQLSMNTNTETGKAQYQVLEWAIKGIADM